MARLCVFGKLTSVFLGGAQMDESCLAGLQTSMVRIKRKTILSFLSTLCHNSYALYKVPHLKCGTDQMRTRESVPADSHDRPFGSGSSAVTRPSCAVAVAVGGTTSCSAAPSAVFGLQGEDQMNHSNAGHLTQPERRAAAHHQRRVT